MAGKRDIPDDELESLVGATLAGRFRLERMLGAGGYGAVFAGVQTSVGRKCAVKVLVPNIATDRRNTVRFEREARMTSQLAHPNTVVIYDFGLDEERQLLFLAMEYLEGESLRDRLRSEGTLDITSAVWIAHQAARSLQDSHHRGLVHRDVKPDNVMILDRGGDANFVKMIDFGIAKFLEDKAVRDSLPDNVTVTGMVIGTPAYMAPEQVRNRPLDGRTDQYALATCVYQMLSGRTVFLGDSPVDIATRQLIERPIPLRTLRPELDVDRHFDEVLLRALRKEPDERFPSIREFADALADAAGVPLPQAVESDERARLEPDARPTVDDGILDLSTTEEDSGPAALMVSTTSLPVVEAADHDDEVEGATTEPTSVSGTGDSTGLDLTASGAVVKPIAVDDVPGGTLPVSPRPKTRSSTERGFGEPSPQEPSPQEPSPQEPSPQEPSPQEPSPQEPSPQEPSPDAPPRVAVRLLAAFGLLLALLTLGVIVTDDEPAPSPAVSGAEGPAERPSTSATDRPPPPEGRAARPRAAPEKSATISAKPGTERDAPNAGRTSPSGDQATEQVVERSVEADRDAGTPRASRSDGREKFGHLTVMIVPWGTLYVDGRRQSDEGRQTLRLSQGRHDLQLRQNGEVVARKTVDVEVGRNRIVELIAH